MILLLVQKKLSNLERDVLFDLNEALRMFTRCVVILKRVEDLQLGVESYQNKLNITKPETFRSDITSMTPYIAYNNPQGIIYLDKFQRNRLMRSNELYKFCDGTITFFQRVLHDIASSLEMNYLPKRRGDEGDVIFIEIIKQDDDSHIEEPEVGENAGVGESEVEYFDIFMTRSELAYHKYQICGPIPSIFLRNPIITEGCPSNHKVPCNIGHVHVEKAYIDLNSPLNVMTQMLYNWIMRRKLDPRENTNGRVNKFTKRIKGMHVLVGNFTYVIDFMIIEDISSIIDLRLSQVVIGRPFVEISNMTHDPPEGVKGNKEKDKIGTKPDQIEIKLEAWKSPANVKVHNAEKVKKIQTKGTKMVENSNLEEHLPPVVTMADNRTMAELLRAPTEGYAEAIMVPPILAEQFKLKHRAARRWLEKEPLRSITTWEDLLSKFINEFFPPSRTTSLRNEISNFQQKINESYHEAWDRYKDLLRAFPHHGFTKFLLHQLNTFYNALNPADQDSLNAAAGGNLLERSTQDVLTIIRNKSKVRNSQSKPLVSQVKACEENSNSEIAKLNHAVNQQTSAVTTAMTAMLKQFQATLPSASVKAVEEICVTCGGAHPYYQCLASGGNTFPEFGDNIQGYVSAAAVNYNQGNLGYRPQGVANQIRPPGNLKAITTRSGVSYDGPLIPPPVVENKPEATKDIVNPTNNEATEDVQPQVVQSKLVTSEPANTPFASTLKSLIENKEKLSEMAQTPLNEHCFVVLLKKLLEKLGDPGKFLIPCDFLGMAKCLALADLEASINLMPYSVWKKLSLPELTPTCMTLELTNRSISQPVGVAKHVYVKVGSFHILTDFVVVDFDVDPRVPLILERSFLKIEKSLIDVFEGELTLRVGKEAITFNLDQTSRYSANYNDMTAKRIDVIDMACEEYSPEVFGFFDTISSGNPTPCYDSIVFTTSLTLTPFRNSDFLLEEVDAFLAIEDETTSSQFP
nr:reverse transcriptase domain-containing protein [Tanacetum cinerariifolium]